MGEPFLIEMKIKGASRTVETNWGPREDRDDLAEFCIDVDPARAWHVYRQALDTALTPDVGIVFTGGLSDDAAKALNEEFDRRRRLS